VSLLDSLWQQLADRRAAVVTCCGATVDALGPADDRWGRSIFAQLHHAPLADLCLHDLHVVLAAAGGGPGTASHIRYHEITGDQPTPLAPLLGRVVAAERRRRVTELLRDDRLDPATEFDRDPFRGARPLVDAGSKLAGNSLANFSAFLARDWRAHDWRWGRLDAAAGMVDVVLDTARAGDVEALSGEFVDKPPPGVDRREWAAWIRPGPGEAPAAVVRRALCARLQYEVLGEAPRDRPDGSLRTAVAVMDRPKARLGDLRRRYLFGLASRMLHLSYRGMWPSTWTFPTSMGRLAMIALRPLLVCLPLLAAPERALLALVGIAWLAPLASDGDVVAPDVGPWALGTGAVVLLACGLIGVVRAGAAWRRWSQIEEAVPAPAPDVGWTEVSAWSRDGRRRVAALAVAAVAVLAWAGYLLFRLAVGDTASPWSPSVLSIVVVALAGLAATAWVNTVPTPATRAAAVRLGPYAVVVVAVAVVGVAALHLPAVAAVTAVVPAVWQVVGVTAAVAALLYDGWACWLPHGLLAVGASAALGAVVATAPWFGGPWPPMWAAVAGVVGVAVVAAGLLTPRDVDAADELAA
jgi:hypothetical protein